MNTEARRRPPHGLAIGLMVVVSALAAALIAAPAQAAKDRNHDGISDRWEKRYDLSLKRDQAKRDQDRDGLKNVGEFKARMNPRDDDSDDDGIDDADEAAGTIASFDAATGALVIDAFVGPDLSGTVNADTEIECEGDEQGEDNDGDHSGPGPDDDQAADNSGPGSHGEDNSGHGRSRDDGDDDDADENCGTGALEPGTVVSAAELRLTQGGTVFEEIELR